MRRRWVFVPLFFVVLMVASPAHSEDRNDPGEFYDVYTLGEVVVTGEHEGVEAATTVRRVTAEEIRNEGARTLGEALELLPGVVVRVGAEGTPRVDMRGLRSRHIILLLDGIPINSTNDGQFDPSLIPIENIAEIKVSYSNHSVLYGDGGLAGVINIVTKKGAQGIHGMASAEAGEGDHYLERLYVNGAQEKWNFFVSGSLFNQHAYPLSDDFDSTSEEDGDLRENSDFERNNLFANVSYSPSEEWEFGVAISVLDGEFGIPPSVINDRTDPFANPPKYDRVEDTDGVSGQFAVRYDPPNPLEIRSWIYFNQLDEERNRYDDSGYDSIERRGSFHTNEKTTVSGFAVQPQYGLGSAGQITGSLNIRQEKFESDGFQIVSAPGGGTAAESLDEDKKLDVYSASVEYNVNPLDKLGLVLGYYYSWLDKEQGDDDGDWGLLAGAYYDLFESTRVKGSVSRQIRFPSIRQLYGAGEGNPDLSTEKSWNYEAGVEQRLPWSTWASFTAFFLDVKDFIEKIPPDDIFTNNDKYEFKGFEIVAENRAVENLLLRLGYTFLDSKDKSPGSERDELQYRPKHKLTLDASYSFTFGLTAYMSVQYVADQVFYSRNEPLQKKDLNDYALVNVKVEQALLKNDVLRLYAGIDNLFDEDYEESYGFPREGRFFYGGGRVVF